MAGSLIHRYILYVNIITQRVIKNPTVFILTHPVKIELSDQTIPGSSILNTIPHRHILWPDIKTNLTFFFINRLKNRQIKNIKLIYIADQQCKRHLQHLCSSPNNLKIVSLEEHINILSLNSHPSCKLSLGNPPPLEK